MPTQTINFANVSSASYNGTSLSEIKLNSTSIWQSKFSTTMTVGSKSYQYCGSKNCTTDTMYGFQQSSAIPTSWNGYAIAPSVDVLSEQFITNFGSMSSTSGGVMTNHQILGITWTDPNSNGGRVAMWYYADHFPNAVDPSTGLPMHLLSASGNTISAGNLQTLKIGNTSLNLQSVDTAITKTYGTFDSAGNFTKQANAPDMTYVDWDVSGNPFPSVGNTVTIEVT